jgi:ATP-dependent RNA helicase RhlE
MLRHILLLLSCAALSLAFAPPSRRRFSKEQFRLAAAEPEYDENASFQDLGLNPEALTAIRAQQGWTTPTPIQQLVIPKLLDLAAEEDSSESSSHADSVWCEAPTGSGKTAAYALPLLQNLKLQPQKEGARIASLILCPTRELADQIGSVVTNLASNMSTKKSRKLNVMTIYGGTRMEPQISELADYARNGQTLDILIATPGRMVDVLTYYQSEAGDSSAADAAFERRLLDAMEQTKSESLTLEQIQTMKLDRSDDDGRGSLINLLADLQYFVVDEADRLLGRAFESEMDKVMELLPSKVQTWLFSATFPKEIEPRVDQVLKRIGATTPIRISCANSDRLLVASEEVSSSLAKRLDRASTATQVQQVGPASTIQLRTIRLETPARTQALRLLLEEHPEWDRVLVFVATRYAAEHVARKLRKAGIGAAELHGKLDQDARTRRLEDLKRGKVRVLLATDVASRGLDIVGLPVMINYDLPRSTADFVHRVGRTGRAGRSGTAITFVTPSSVGHFDLIETRHLKESVEREILPGFEPNEERWEVEAEASKISAPGTQHSGKGLVHDRMFGGIKSRRKSKKDKLREKAVKEAAKQGAVE